MMRRREGWKAEGWGGREEGWRVRRRREGGCSDGGKGETKDGGIRRREGGRKPGGKKRREGDWSDEEEGAVEGRGMGK